MFLSLQGICSIRFLTVILRQVLKNKFKICLVNFRDQTNYKTSLLSVTHLSGLKVWKCLCTCVYFLISFSCHFFQDLTKETKLKQKYIPASVILFSLNANTKKRFFVKRMTSISKGN